MVPGAGAYEVAVHLAIRKGLNELKGKARLGLQAYADAMLVIPKTLAQNAGTVIRLIRTTGQILNRLTFVISIYNCFKLLAFKGA